MKSHEKLDVYRDACDAARTRADDRREPLWIALAEWLEAEVEVIDRYLDEFGHGDQFTRLMAAPSMEAGLRLAWTTVYAATED